MYFLSLIEKRYLTVTRGITLYTTKYTQKCCYKNALLYYIHALRDVPLRCNGEKIGF